jgi:hypothetical protein
MIKTGGIRIHDKINWSGAQKPVQWQMLYKFPIIIQVKYFKSSLTIRNMFYF